MAKTTKSAVITLLLMPNVERELAPILTSSYTVQVFLDVCPYGRHLNTRALHFYRTAKVERYDSILASIRFYPYPLDGDRRFQMRIGDREAPLWAAQADTAEEAVEATNAALKRLVAEERAARRAAQAERLAAYDRQRAEAAA